MFQSNNPEVNSYFASLPHFIQEAITQSSVEIKSLEDLKKIACNLQSKADQSKS